MHRASTRIVCLAALWLGGCQPPPHEHEEQGTFLVTHPLRKDTELTKEYVAQIRAIQHIELRALERGYVQDIFVDEGQGIERGSKMFQIMPFIYQAEVSKAKAETELASIEYQNTQMLADRDIVSPSELALAKAKVNRAKAQQSLAETHKRLTEIRAPFDGIMGRFHVRTGSLVEEGDLLTTLSDNSTMWVYFNVTEREYLDYQSKTQAEKSIPVRLVMANGKTFDEAGRVETIEADFNNETGNIAFRAAFPNPKGFLRHGETGKVLMPVPFDDALIIPQKATFEVLDRQFVFVVDEAGIVRTRAITIAAELPHLYVIESGLQESDTVLLEGLRKVRDGIKIDTELHEPSEVLASLDLPAE